MKLLSNNAFSSRVLKVFCGLSFFLFLVLSSSAFATTSEDYEKALKAYNEGTYDDAYIHLKNSLQKDPNNLAAKILIGEILLINGYLTDAEAEFQESLEMGADVNLVAEPLGNVWLFLNKYQDVVNFDGVNELSGDALRDWLMIRATACSRLNDEQCALSDYNTIIAKTPNFVPAINGLASIALNNSELSKAADLVEKAIGLAPQNAIAWRLKGQLAYRMGNKDDAVTFLQKSLTFKRDDPITLRNLIDLYLESKDYDTAKLFVNEIIQDTPNDPLAILLDSWLQSRDSEQPIDNEKLTQLNDFISQLDPELIASQPMLLYIAGLTRFFNNNMEAAAKDFNAYLQKEPDDLQAVLMLSQVYMATQQDKQALLLLERYQDALMGEPDSALVLGDLFIRQNKSFKAERLLRELELQYPNDGRLQLFKIKLMAARGKQAEALNMLEQNLEKFKHDVGFLFTYALVNLQSEQYDTALKGVNLLSNMLPDDAEVYNLKAGILIRQGKLEQARDNIKLALEKKPTLFSAKFNLAATESRLGNIEESNEIVSELLKISPQHTTTLMLKAFNLTQLGRLDLAKQIYLDLLTLSPSNIDARNRLSLIYQQQQDFENAIYHLDLLLKDNFDNSDYLMRKASLQLSLGKVDDAKKTLKVVRNLIDDDPLKLLTYASIASALNDNEQIREALTRAYALDSNNNAILLRLTSFLLDEKENSRAQQLLTQMSSSLKETPQYFYLLGRLEANKGNDDKAINAFENALKIAPSHDQALIAIYNYALRERYIDTFLTSARGVIEKTEEGILAKHLLAQFLFFTQEYDESISLYLELVESPATLNPSEAYNRLAMMHIERSLDTAEQYASEAYKLRPNSAKVLDTFGYIKALKGDLEGSLKMLRDAFARDASDPNIRYHLGFTLAKLNRTAEAKKELTFAVNTERPFFKRPQARALLESL